MTLIDPVAGKLVGTIPIGGELKFLVAEGKWKLYMTKADMAEIFCSADWTVGQASQEANVLS